MECSACDGTGTDGWGHPCIYCAGTGFWDLEEVQDKELDDEDN